MGAVAHNDKKARLTREENRDSRAIYKKKHNDKVQ